MQLYFIRHGQSENNLLWTETASSEGRSEDPELTPVGRQQAEAVARFLTQSDPMLITNPHVYDTQNVGGFGITHIYCSLMIRAVATATIIARELSLPLVAWEEVHEEGGIHQKDEETGERVGLPGKNNAYFEAHYPDLILPDSLSAEGWWNRPFEPYEERPLRARRFLHAFLDRHGGTEDRVAVVSHGGFYNQLLRAIFDLPDGSGFWFALNNAAITRLDFGQEEVVLSYSNRTDFLPREMIT
jgi:2,3-bisphosphoglycerate-dependent phosphoglycerate mutase